MRPYEAIGEKTEEMENAVYAALDAIDAYKETAERLIAEEQASGEPRQSVVKRLTQFVGRADHMIGAIEDQVLSDMNFCRDRLFSVKMAEDGEFI